jgi:sporulation protein YlmC with PRC-barrel domain
MADENVLEWRGCDVIDSDGDKVGTLEQIYLDEQTKKPEWAIVTVGFMGRRSTFVPLIGAMREGDMIRVRYDKDLVKDAPKVDPEGGLSQDEEEQVYRHYGLDYSRAESESGLPDSPAAGETGAAAGRRAETETSAGAEAQGARGDAPERRDETAPGRDAPDPERATVPGAPGGAGGEVVGRLRLRKYVVTEHVPVQREEVRLEPEPEGDQPRGEAGPREESGR